MKVDRIVLHEAMRAFYMNKRFGITFKFKGNADYLVFGITHKQWARYIQTGKLKVRQDTAMKLRHASMVDSPHAHALFKVIEARYGK